MKKYILLLLICVCFIFTGCSSYGGVELTQNSDGSVVESYYIPFPAQEIMQKFREYGYTSRLNSFINGIKSDCDNNIFGVLIDEYQQRIDESDKYTTEEKAGLIAGVSFTSNLTNNMVFNTNLNYILYELNFNDNECYWAFKNMTPSLKEGRETVVEKGIFTTTTKVVKDPILNNLVDESLTLGKKILNKIDEHLTSAIGRYHLNDFKSSLNYEEYSSKFNYTYVVPTQRLHSNADVIEEENGYYYHTWTIPLNSLNEDGESTCKIEYWTVSANRWIWYVATVTISMVIVCGVVIYDRLKRKINKQQKETIEL